MRLKIFIVLLMTTSRLEGKSIPPSHYDKDFDYSRFVGRMTDKNDNGHLLKIFSKNTTVRYLRSGDKVFFKLPFGTGRYCKSSVRNTEKTNYFVIYARDLTPCLRKGETSIRRGSKLHFLSHRLTGRVQDAHQQHQLLAKRRHQFLKQLNDINHFVWTYQQQKIKLSAKYKQEMVKIQQEEQRAMDILKEKKKDGLLLQRELNQRLDKLDKDLIFYSIEKSQKIQESWQKKPNKLF